MNGDKCPVCKKPTDAEYQPFCSKRCADIDLGRWLDERYRIPIRQDDDEDGPGELSGEK